MTGEASEGKIYQAPYVLAMIVCDAVHIDHMTGKPTILGCFASIASSEFPALHSSMTVFAELTDVRGRVPISLRIIDVDEVEDPLFFGESAIDLNDPILVARLVLTIEGVTFPQPGEYRVQLFSGDEPLCERRILLTEIS